MSKHSGLMYPNGKTKSWLLEIALSARDFGCSLKDYAYDLAVARAAEAQKTSVCQWTVDESGRRFVDGFTFVNADHRLEIVEDGFRFVPTTTRVFICYAREDFRHANRLYKALRAAGANPWLDSRNFVGGEQWEAVIEEEIANATHFIALLSSRSVTKRGYVQSEIRRALWVWDRLPGGVRFLIPARLDECIPSHASLDRFQRVDLFPRWQSGLQKLFAAVGLGAQARPSRRRVQPEKKGARRRPSSTTQRRRR